MVPCSATDPRKSHHQHCRWPLTMGAPTPSAELPAASTMLFPIRELREGTVQRRMFSWVRADGNPRTCFRSALRRVFEWIWLKCFIYLLPSNWEPSVWLKEPGIGLWVSPASLHVAQPPRAPGKPCEVCQAKEGWGHPVWRGRLCRNWPAVAICPVVLISTISKDWPLSLQRTCSPCKGCPWCPLCL